MGSRQVFGLLLWLCADAVVQHVLQAARFSLTVVRNQSNITRGR